MLNNLITNEEIASCPKSFCDSAAISHITGVFLFVFASGERMDGYAMTPEQAEAFHNALGKNIAMYKKDGRLIDKSRIRTSDPVVSPIQMDDMGDDSLKA